MKICFLSNYFNHHQKPLSDELYRLTSGHFCFVATSEISEWRKQLGYKVLTAPYVLNYNVDNDNGLIDRIVLDSDIVILGAADKRIVQTRLKNGKLTYLCTERIYWNGVPWYKLISHFVKFGLWYRRFKSLYLLCASAYTGYDFQKTCTFKNMAFKWGYFPANKHYDVDALIDRKEQLNQVNGSIRLLWVGRLISWKHPESCIFLAKHLKEKHYHFKISIIGIGEMSSDLQASVSKHGLTDEIEFLGSMSPEEVREYMEVSSIFILTSDEQEGWGAVLNEAMNSACAVIASRATGSAPYLISNENNGVLFNSLDWGMLSSIVERLIIDPEKRRTLSVNAYKTIDNEWNAEIAAIRLISLSKCLMDGKPNPYSSGPCSHS